MYGLDRMITNYDNVRECMEDLGSFGAVAWIYGYRFGHRFEWIFRDKHMLVYMQGENTVLDTRHIKYEGRFRGYSFTPV